MRKIRRRDLQLVVAASLISCMVVATGIWAVLNPPPIEPFFALFTLGQGMRIERYYPNDNPNIPANETVLWYVGVYNHMGSAQYVEIRFKLLNASLQQPDSARNLPSNIPSFSSVRRLLGSNETFVSPVAWSITRLSRQGDSLRIDSITFNGDFVTENLETTARSGYNFRIVIELWVFNIETGDFMFWWVSGSERRSAWNQVWFNATMH